MVNLAYLNTPPINSFIAIVNDKNNLEDNDRKTRLLNLVPNVSLRYNVYKGYFDTNTLESVPLHNFNNAQAADLLHCYNVETSSLNSLIVAIKENQEFHLRGLCQFCGINTDSTTDHYLPKGKFPDFCVNLLNLFPCCPDCNSLKGVYYFDTISNTRGIINLYLDSVPQIQFLFADIVFTGNIPKVTFRVQNPNGINAQLFSIIHNHYKRLNLAERYKEKFNTVYTQTYRSFAAKPRYHGHPNRVRDFLISDANELFRDFGRNYYVAIVKQALSTNNTFLNLF